MTSTCSIYRPGLNRFAAFTAVTVLLLIGLGGLVTSYEAGMAVPDWPTTFGYNMFLFPVSQWRGGVLFEHVHRLVASGVGVLTVLLALWMWRCEGRAWVRRLGWLAVLLVAAQSLLGGLRVTETNDQLGIAHAALAHVFLVLVSMIALVTSRTWLETSAPQTPRVSPDGLTRIYCLLTSLILLQSLLAAAVRHQHAGLVIPDFPTTFGQWWPDLSAEAIAQYNQIQFPGVSPPRITAFRASLHLAHRALALVITCGVAWATWQTTRRLGIGHPLSRICRGWMAFILLQFSLGAATVWTGKAPGIATLHVVFGAVTLVGGSVLTLLAPRLPMRWPADQTPHEPDRLRDQSPTPSLQGCS